MRSGRTCWWKHAFSALGVLIASCTSPSSASRHATTEQEIPRGAEARRHWETWSRGRWEAEPFLIRVGDQTLLTSTRTLGAELNFEVSNGLLTARSTRHIEVDRAVLQTQVEAIAALVESEPLPARWTPTGIEGGRQGRRVDRTEAAQVIHDALVDGQGRVEVPLRVVEAPLPTIRTLANALYNSELGESRSRYPVRSGRGTNIERAALELDGFRLLPGQVLSFNEVVGERTLARGFAAGPELGRDGESVEGIGGGICQVATALFEAALLAGLRIVERYPHSRPPGYARRGKDAAVSWNGKDLRLANPYPFPILLRVTATGGGLSVEWMGQERLVDIELETNRLGGTRYRLVRRVSFEGETSEEVFYTLYLEQRE